MPDRTVERSPNTGQPTESQIRAAERVRDLFAELGITETDFVAEHGLISPQRAQSKLRGITALSSLDFAVAAKLCIDQGRRVTVDYLLRGPLGPDDTHDFPVTGIWCPTCDVMIARITSGDPFDTGCPRCGGTQDEPADHALDWGD